ncbi:Pre-rRNA-processing protein TSR2-domain-containing protein [Irpex rosettiformis]|uniref:Pre-rRNA-processing protein TSR2-domain-containing protein n=1 Tax=Irpex rosettiformis TaxID=378272 RepID=A0ACB8TQA8_9APHY|nr:Pre-rRNA-processing protein TSR2-domain-containing protein [Irpex rosettiformis]
MSASTSEAQAPTATPSPVSVLFARGVIARLATWPALRISVDQSWGGPDSSAKRTWLASVIVDAFEEEDPKPDATYVELTLLQVMEDEFDTVLEDGSAEIVATDIAKLWAEVQNGNDVLVKRLEEEADKAKGRKIEVEEAPADNSDWEDESGEESDGDEDDAPMLVEPETKSAKPEPEIDEDGFTTVKGKGTRHR